ncbi:MAG: DUF3261 domain-containing protein [Desulfobacteraceae bacterium]|nr:DUF3261 domain-containing protein [Desulfobacteraceae bacterium]
MSAIGITKLDSKNDSFSVAGLTPMGMTLFKIKMEKGKVISSFVMPQFGADDLNKTADMISKDIARIYFNRKIKFSKKSFEHKKFVIIINTESDIKKYKFTFGGRPLKLITKSMYENKKKIWSVDYYDYQKINTREIPFKIFFKNYKYGYTLEVETKEIKRELIK